MNQDKRPQHASETDSAAEQNSAFKQLVAQEQSTPQAWEQAQAAAITKLKAELEAARARLEEANQNYREATEQISALKQRVTQDEAMQQGVEQARAQAAAQLAEAQRSFQEERKAFQQQLAQSIAEGQAKTATMYEGEKKLIRLESELEARSRLEEANQKYRGATEQVTTLKQRVTQEEMARKTVEQALQAAESKLTGLGSELAAVRTRVEEESQKYRGATEQVTTLKQRVTEEETARQAAEQVRIQVTTQLEQAQRRFQNEQAALQQQLAQLNAEGQAKQMVADKATKSLVRVEAELEGVRTQLGEANQKYRSVTEQIAALKQRVTEKETARQQAEQALAQATRQLEQTRSHLQNEQAALQQQLVQATAEGQVKWVAVQQAEGKLLRLEGELEGLNQKYRGMGEQVAALKQRVAQEETARQQAEQALAQVSAESAKNLLRVEAELETRRSQLEAANQKYRSITEQLAELKQRVAEDEAARQVIVQELRHTNGQLDLANSKYRQVTGRQIPELKSKLEQQQIVARQQLERTRAAISFRLGYLLTHNFKSVNGFLSLPSALWALRKETIRRRKKKEFIPSPPKLSSLSEPSLIVSRENTVIDSPSQKPSSNGRAISFDVSIARHGTIPHGQLTIACIMDEFTCGAFQPDARLQQLTPSHWRAELESAHSDLLFIESAWRGKDDLWGNKVSHTSAELQGIVEWCRAKHIPTVFWCKEDPIHFETFLNTAMLFDYVFTTDIDCIHRYKAALGHNRVYLLPFACQPAINNPIETYQRKDAFCFAGAYYVRYPERTRDLGDFALELPAFRPLEIYDRNFGKNDPNYQFPAEYRQYIVGTLPFDQIDKAYKGYRYAINLNSIKQSQSMFARRVFELLASNTITISNFSRGLRLLFGDLVITSDSGYEIVRRLKKVADNEAHSRKLRLIALRKVMREHTYAQRLAYVVAKVSGKAVAQAWPHMAVLAYAASQHEMDSIQAHYHRQRYAHTSLSVVVGNGMIPPVCEDPRVRVLTCDQAKDLLVGALGNQTDLVAGMVAEDYYGPNYLEDIALATRYTQVDLIGKAARYIWRGGTVQLTHADQAYHPVQGLPARASAIRRQAIAQESVLAWMQSMSTHQLQADQGLAIDEFNYCEQGAAADAELIKETVDDLPGLNTGIAIDDLLAVAERIAPERSRHEDCPILFGAQLAGDFGKKPSSAITLAVDGQSWRVGSMLSDGKHEYLYATADHRPEELGFAEQLKVYFDVTPGLNIQLVVQFLDAQKQKISHVIIQANRNQEAGIPPGTDRVRFGLRVYAGGQAEIKGLVLGHKNLQPAEILGQADHLLLTNHYPSYDDLYRNGFVHTRVAAYAARGTRVDVFRLRADEGLSYHEFHNVDVFTGPLEALHMLLTSGSYKSVLVHFLDEAMWQVLQHHVKRVKIFVWIHGFEIQPWHRRDNFENEQQRDTAKIQSKARMIFWRGLLRKVPDNLTLIFVSKYLAEVTMEDLGFRLPDSRYAVIHNAIDTDCFTYQKKPVEQRKKILSIRPYASRTYANDLSVKAILALAEKPYFKDLEFRMVGDGRLFDEVLEPLRGFNNVYIERRFLTHREIAAMHREHGIFLCPSRMDTQGVSRDEAMASGLVPVTNSVGAIPEFVDETCGMLAPPEDAAELAEAIEKLYHSPKLFSAMSAAAAARVRRESSSAKTIDLELKLFSHEDHPYARTDGTQTSPVQRVRNDAAA